MKSTQYSEKVLDHFRHPRNVGTLEGDDISVGRVGNPVCGDLMEIYIKVENGRIKDIKFKTFGCGSAIATASMITELAMGKTIDEAMKITRKDVADELDGLPPIKMHCSNLATDALKDAIHNYQKGIPGRKEMETVDSMKCSDRIQGAEDFLDKGVYLTIGNPNEFKDKRVLVMDTGERSVEIALQLANYAPRVVFVTRAKGLQVYPRYREELAAQSVRILYESELLEVLGTKVVERVRIHDLNEDETYELFVDAVVTPTASK
jgi:FeS cluster assembly scaffold protein NifU